MSIIELLKIPGISQVLPLITSLIAAAKAKDWMTVLSLLVQIIGIIKPIPPVPTPTPGPTPQPVFAAAEPTDDEIVAHAATVGCDESDIKQLLDALK